MELAVLLNVHSNPAVIIDTIESICAYATKKILLLIEGTAWNELKAVDFGVPVMEGFKHTVPKSPYRNVALGLKTLLETWPDADWYCYTEYDTLFTSTRFLRNLQIAEEKEVWMLGSDGRVDTVNIQLVEAMLGEKLRSVYYLLGCCQFFHKNFMKKLLNIDFFNRFLNLTSGFTKGFFPYYDGYDLSEHLYPTLCRQMGGNIGVFSTYDLQGNWHGSYKVFPLRWKPELNAETENFPEASIMHPLKTYDHPIRQHHRSIRSGIVS